MAGAIETWVVGTFDPTIGRTQLLLEGMRARGWPTSLCIQPAWGRTQERVAMARGGLANPQLAWRLARAYASIGFRLRRQRPAPRVLLVGYPGQLDAVVLRAFFPRAVIVLDAFVAIDETLADRGIGSPTSAARRLSRTIDRLSFRVADRSIVDTAAHARRLTIDYGLEPQRVILVPVGAHDPVGARVQETADRGVRPSQTLTPDPRPPTPTSLDVLYFGGFIPLHGVPTIIEAARGIGPEEGIRLTLVGEGQEAAAAERELRESPLPHVRLLRTWISEAQLVAQHIVAADVCLGVFGSGSKALDVVPAKVYLALACGRAVVTGDTAAIREEVLAWADPDDPPLLLVPPGDASTLADTLRLLADDPHRRARMGAAARRVYDQRFRPEVAVGALLETLESLASS